MEEAALWCVGGQAALAVRPTRFRSTPCRQGSPACMRRPTGGSSRVSPGQVFDRYSRGSPTVGTRSNVWVPPVSARVPRAESSRRRSAKSPAPRPGPGGHRVLPVGTDRDPALSRDDRLLWGTRACRPSARRCESRRCITWCQGNWRTRLVKPKSVGLLQDMWASEGGPPEPGTGQTPQTPQTGRRLTKASRCHVFAAVTAPPTQPRPCLAIAPHSTSPPEPSSHWHSPGRTRVSGLTTRILSPSGGQLCLRLPITPVSPPAVSLTLLLSPLSRALGYLGQPP